MKKKSKLLTYFVIFEKVTDYYMVLAVVIVECQKMTFSEKKKTSGLIKHVFFNLASLTCHLYDNTSAINY